MHIFIRQLLMNHKSALIGRRGHRGQKMKKQMAYDTPVLGQFIIDVHYRAHHILAVR